MIWRLVSSIGIISGITMTLLVAVRQFVLHRRRSSYTRFLSALAHPPYQRPPILEGKTVLITGANSGIGKAAALELLMCGARVIMACRDRGRAEAAARDILLRARQSKQRLTGDGRLVIKSLDLADLGSVRALAADIIATEARLDLLIDNAGVFTARRQRTAQDFEFHFGVNHLGHFYLTLLLLPLLRKSGRVGCHLGIGDGTNPRARSRSFESCTKSRIVVVASALHKYSQMDLNDIDMDGKRQGVIYGHWAAYSTSKLANVLFAKELARRLETGESLGYHDDEVVYPVPTNVTVSSLHPGVVVTDMSRNLDHNFIGIWIYRNFGTILAKTPHQGCQTTLYCALAPELENVSGRYYGDCTEHECSPKAMDTKLAKDLWDYSLKCILRFEAGLSSAHGSGQIIPEANDGSAECHPKSL